jgi:hypothetical protein
MKTVTVGLLMIVLTLLAGCAPYANLDRQFGRATQASLDQQVAYPDYRYAKGTPEGMAGINAEEVMDIYNQTYAEKPEKSDTYEMQFVPGNSGK